MGILEGKIAVVTGAGHGIGRAEALELAAQGARVVVNDIGAAVTGGGSDHGPADAVVAMIRGRGGEAVASYDDISKWDGAAAAVRRGVDEWGGLDVLVNNAGVLRYGAFVNISEDDWDALMHVHLKGTFLTMRHAASYWKAEAEAGRRHSAAIINTTSGAGLPGGSSAFGMECYGAMKAGIAALTVGTAPELSGYGARVNAIAPTGSTRMLAYGLTGDTGYKEAAEPDAANPVDPAINGPLVAWLASDEAKHVTGQVFGVRGRTIVHYVPWHDGESVGSDGPWEASKIGAALNAFVFGSWPKPRGAAPDPTLRLTRN
jgi:NAD(P)-dependent dehydrogenase (short-subunit alcohol dehydrogenase family)